MPLIVVFAAGLYNRGVISQSCDSSIGGPDYRSFQERLKGMGITKIENQGGDVQMKKSIFRVIEPYLYLFPAMFFFAAFLFYPFFKTVRLSFALTTPLGGVASFVGIDNYISIFTSKSFLNSLFVTLRYSVMSVVFSIVIGFVLAIASNEDDVKGKNIFRTIYALPMAVSAAAASVVFMFIFHSNLGILNKVLGTHIGWLTDPKYALIAVTIVTVWMNIGLNFIFLTAALQSVPIELYESAAIEGAGFFNKHRHITIPCISPTLFFLLIINVINAVQAYAQVKMMTQGGPSGSTDVIVYEIYQEAFMNSRFGLACAESIVLFVILMLLTLVQFKLEKKVTY